MVRILPLLLVGSLAFAGSAQQSLMLAGTVSEDRLVLTVRPHFLAAEGVTVRLYRDDGDRLPSAADRAVATTKTDRGGMYVFRVAEAGAYWVTVDSRSFHPGGWPEQTFGPAGSLCAHPDGTTRTTLYEGACFGGRTVAGSDDASSLATSEHLALIELREPATSVDFAFSHDAVIHTRDGERLQGSLRQYFENANAVRGINRMRFVPMERAPEQRDTVMGLPPRWWKITLTKALPELRDDDTVIDGTAYNYLSPASPADVHPGRFGEAPTLVVNERQVSRLRKPELEIVGNGSAGIVCGGRCGMRGFAIHGTALGIVTRADARVEHVLVGAAPDGTPAGGGEVGVQVEKGTLGARHLLVTTQSRTGIYVAPEARLDGEHLDVSRNGQPTSGAGIVLLSKGSSIRSSQIAGNPGAGIILGAIDGTAPANGTTIDGSTISGNLAGVVLAPGSLRNAVTRNDILWNRTGGVVIAPYSTAPPRENRISANRFNENGLRPIVLNLGTENPNQLAASSETCTPSATAPNGGISAPRMTTVRVADEGGLRARITGRACPGQIVELYQSFVTSGISDGQPDMPDVRDDDIERETLTTQGRASTLPSIGEFNYLGATITNADGSFEAIFPLPVVNTGTVESNNTDATDVWATQVLPAASPSDRGFSAIAIDAAGNTSEMSIRRKAD